MKYCDLQINGNRCYYKLTGCDNKEFMKLIEYKSWEFNSWKFGKERKYFVNSYINRSNQKILWSSVGFSPLLVRYLQSLGYMINGKELFRSKEISIGNMLYDLYDYQQDAIQAWINTGCCGVIQMATGCLTGDNVIYTNKGLVTIKEIYDKKYKDLKVMNYNGIDIEYNEIDDYYRYKNKEIIYIRTKFGFEIKCTPEHKIVSFDKDGILKFIEAGSLKMGNVVPISYGHNCFGDNVRMRWDEGQTYLFDVPDNEKIGTIEYSKFSSIKGNACIYPLIMNKDLAEFLGYFISEGYMSEKIVFITNTDKKINERVEYLSKKLFNCESKIIIESKKNNEDYGRQIHSVGLVSFLYRLDLNKKSSEKEVPVEILKSSKEVYISFLRALYSGDGCICKEKKSIDYTSMSYKLCKQVQMMLLNLGIFSSLTQKDSYCNNKYCGKVSSVTIYGDNVLIFKGIIGFDLEYRQKSLNEICKQLEKIDRWTQMTVPNIYLKIKELNDITKEKKYIYVRHLNDTCSYNKLLNIYGFNGVHMWTDGRRFPSKRLLRRLLDMFSNIPEAVETDSYRYLSYICNFNVEYDSIEYIEKRKNEDVYDLTIKDIPHYISNGFVVHNSGKTITASSIIRRMRIRTLTCMHTSDLLINAWLNTLVEQFGESIRGKIGIVGGGLSKKDRKNMRLISDTSYQGNIKQDIVLATSQSLLNNLDKLVNERFGLIIWDEVHHVASEQFSKVAGVVRAPYRLGLSATLLRSDGTSPAIWGLLGNIVYKIKIKELIKKGVLVNPIFNTMIINDNDIQRDIATCGLTKLDLSRYVKNASASSVVKRDYIMKLIKSLHVNRKKFIMYTDFVEPSNSVFTRDYYVGQLNNIGIKAIGVSSDMTGSEREKVFNLLQNDKIDGLIFGKLGAEGVNIPKVDSVIMCNSTKSTILFPQRVGRAMRSVRNDPTKTNAFIYEIVLNTSMELKWSDANFFEYEQEGYIKQRTYI